MFALLQTVGKSMEYPELSSRVDSLHSQLTDDQPENLVDLATKILDQIDSIKIYQPRRDVLTGRILHREAAGDAFLELARYKAHTQFLLGTAQHQLKAYEEAADAFDKAVYYGHDADNLQLIIEAYLRKSQTLFDAGKNSEALATYAKSFEFFIKQERFDELATHRLTLAALCKQHDDLPYAVQYLEEAGDYFLGQERWSDAIGAFLDLALTYRSISDNDLARTFLNKTRDLALRLGDNSVVTRCDFELAAIFQEKGEYPGARTAFLDLVTVFEQAGQKADVAETLFRIGQVEYLEQEFEHALARFSAAEPVFVSIEEEKKACLCRAYIGRIFAEDGFSGKDLAKAEEILAAVTELAIRIEPQGDIHESFKALAYLYAGQKRYKEAYFTLKTAFKLDTEATERESYKQTRRFDIDRKISVQKAAEEARIEEQQRLIHNILPGPIADRLLAKEELIADHYDSVAVLFLDISNFGRLVKLMPAKPLVYMLNEIFSATDVVVSRNGLEKIKTIGDAYMAVAGAPLYPEDSAVRAARTAIELMEEMYRLEIKFPDDIEVGSWINDIGVIDVRIGIHWGEAVGGIIGEQKFQFDLWGDAVNTAARMESHGMDKRIHVTEAFKKRVEETQTDTRFFFKDRGEIEVKGKGKMRTFWLEGMHEYIPVGPAD